MRTFISASHAAHALGSPEAEEPSISASISGGSHDLRAGFSHGIFGGFLARG